MRELIEKIEVFEPIKLGPRQRIQKIRIHYNFVGAVEIPENAEMA